MKKESRKFIECLCYILLVTVATLLIFTRILPELGVNFSGKFWLKLLDILNLIQEISLILLACVGAFAFAKSKTKTWLIIYIVAVVICILSIILRLF